MSEDACEHVISYADPVEGGPVSVCSKCPMTWGRWNADLKGEFTLGEYIGILAYVVANP